LEINKLKGGNAVYETILVEKGESIATVVLNRPEKYNAIDMKMREELYFAFRYLEKDSEVRSIILGGVGEAFCSGGDIQTMGEFKANAGRTRLKNIHPLLKLIYTMDKPVIAAVQGHAVGAGMNLALACDFVIGTEDLKMCQSFTKIGLVPDWGGFYILPRRLGLAKAKELIMLAPVITAEEARELGLINKIVKKENLFEEAKDLAQKLASGPRIALALCKTGINKSLESNLDECLDYEALAQDICMQSVDFQEGITAFREKRKPDFRG